MQSYPFPARFHHYRYTGWFSLNLSRYRLAYSHAAVASFQFHDAPQRFIDPADHRVFLRSITRDLNREKSLFLRSATRRYILYKRYLDLEKEAPAQGDLST
jgi:hypothetical protein